MARLSYQASVGALALKRAVRGGRADTVSVAVSEADRSRLAEVFTIARSVVRSATPSAALDSHWESGVERLVEQLAHPVVMVGEDELSALDVMCAALDREASHRFRGLGES